jgi:hypothetical protein
MAMSELSSNARSRGQEDDEEHAWMDDADRRPPSVFALGTTRSVIAFGAVASLMACRDYAVSGKRDTSDYLTSEPRIFVDSRNYEVRGRDGCPSFISVRCARCSDTVIFLARVQHKLAAMAKYLNAGMRHLAVLLIFST